jgi:hypothetical protein
MGKPVRAQRRLHTRISRPGAGQVNLPSPAAGEGQGVRAFQLPSNTAARTNAMHKLHISGLFRRRVFASPQTTRIPHLKAIYLFASRGLRTASQIPYPPSLNCLCARCLSLV